MIYRKGSKWELSPFKVKYTQHGEEIVQYDYDKEWWLGFADRWDHTSITEFIDVIPTEAQISRFKDIEFMPEDIGDAYAEYVEFGVFKDDYPTTHPLRFLQLRKEGEQQGVELSQREINEIMHGVQLSDVEIRLLIGGL